MNAPVLITGATGFVGRALVRALDGPLRCLVRDPAAAAAAGIDPARHVVGGLEDEEALRRAADGVRAVVHLAGATKAVRRTDYYRVNAEGTARLCRVLAAVAPGARLVHVSSLAAAGPSTDGEGSALPPDLCRPRSHYGRSKLAGERHVVASGLGWVVLRPPIIYGPGDDGTRLLLRQSTARLVAVPWTRRPLSVLHVDDAVRALQVALASPLTRRIWPIDGPVRLDTDSLMEVAAAACGRTARLVRVPLVLARLAALGADVGARLRGRPSLFSFDKMRDVGAAGWVADPVPMREQADFVARVDPAGGFARTASAEGWPGAG